MQSFSSTVDASMKRPSYSVQCSGKDQVISVKLSSACKQYTQLLRRGSFISSALVLAGSVLIVGLFCIPGFESIFVQLLAASK